MVEGDWTVRQADSADMAAARLTEIRSLMDAAFGDRFSEADWRHSLGGRHFFVLGPDGTVVSHASVVQRTLEVAGHPFRTGYVEAVATHPAVQRQGLATAIMGVVADFIEAAFELGALSGDPRFYERLGWKKWRGATWCRDGERLIRTPEEDDGVLVWPTRSGAPVDLAGDIAVDWRSGDVW